MEHHPVLGKVVNVNGTKNGKIYTRTVVLCALFDP